MWLHTTHAAEAAQTSAPIRADLAGALDLLPEPYEPVKRLKQIIRFLYELLGGDPSELTESNSLNADMMALVNYYAAHGVPPNLTPAERDAGLAWIEEADELAAVVAPSVSPEVLSAFQATLDSMHAELIGPPHTSDH